ncbi:MAG: pyridoxamine 5'-phosphate oxidase family protein [Cytophagaceae bacterium]|nr:pyridoxamine 5'-phosphate oxidase family protein [Gemmatimonadaceae bacterium]
MHDESHRDGIEKVAELVKDIRTAMLVTQDEQGNLHSRPMGTSEAPFDGSIWFFTPADSSKVTEIAQHPRVNVAYASPSSESYLSLSGTAEVIDDRAKIRELWSPILKAWFDSAEDPNIRLIRVDVDEAEYWDTPGGKVASLIGLVKGMVIGKGADQNNDHGTVRI